MHVVEAGDVVRARVIGSICTGVVDTSVEIENGS